MEKNARKIELPAGVEANVSGMSVTLKAGSRSVSKTFSAEGVQIAKTGNAIVLTADSASNRYVSRMNAMVSHIENLAKGTQQDFQYRMAVVFSHFPMTVNVKDNVVEINNFLGEKKARRAKIIGGCKVSVKGKEVIVSGSNKEMVGQTAANIEGAARVVGRDKRVFQDGIFIVSKAKGN
ncbi:MAG: 50S ribosomal protein L6 [Candidatus Diapherotrites archaeon]|nr:50S ribosomal protein L6 [Candidatus Diapherotrites archaeon]